MEPLRGGFPDEISPYKGPLPVHCAFPFPRRDWPPYPWCAGLDGRWVLCSPSSTAYRTVKSRFNESRFKVKSRFNESRFKVKSRFKVWNLVTKIQFHIKKSRFSVKSRFKEPKCADRGHSLNRDFTVHISDKNSGRIKWCSAWINFEEAIPSHPPKLLPNVPQKDSKP